MNLLEQAEKDRADILSIVMAHMGWDSDKAELWYNTPNPHLGEASPALMVYFGRSDKVFNFIKNAIEGNTP